MLVGVAQGNVGVETHGTVSGPSMRDVAVAFPANSRNKVPVAKGCQTVFPSVIVVPTRMLTRPITLSISSILTEPALYKLKRAVPGVLIGSTCTRDHSNPPDGSTNHCDGSWILDPALPPRAKPRATCDWSARPLSGSVIRIR